jgi:hypothetical protein
MSGTIETPKCFCDKTMCYWEEDISRVRYMHDLACKVVHAVKNQSQGWCELADSAEKSGWEINASMDDCAEHSRIDSKELSEIWASGSRTMYELIEKNNKLVVSTGKHPRIHEVSMVISNLYNVLRCAAYKANMKNPYTHLAKCSIIGCDFDKFAYTLENTDKI